MTASGFALFDTASRHCDIARVNATSLAHAQLLTAVRRAFRAAAGR